MCNFGSMENIYLFRCFYNRRYSRNLRNKKILYSTHLNIMAQNLWAVIYGINLSQNLLYINI